MTSPPHLTGFALASMLVGLVLAAAIAGCREMIATPPPMAPEPEVATRSLIIVGVDGAPVVDAFIRVSDWGMRPYADSEDWSGRTDEEGAVRPEVPPGEYWVKVTPYGAPDNSDDPVWVETRVWIGDETVTVDPRPRVRHGRIEVPPEFPAGDFVIQLLADVEYETHDLSFTVNTGVREDGTFETVWVEEATYSMALGSRHFHTTPRAKMRLDADAYPDHPDSLVITWEPEYFEIELLLGGEPCPPAYVSATVSSNFANFEAALLRTVLGSRFLLPSEPGPMELWIAPDNALPCMPGKFQVDLQPGSVQMLELGEHEVEFRVVDDQGIALRSIEVELDQARSGRWHSLQVRESGRLFLAEGHYKFHAWDLRGDHSAVDLIADIDADTTITFVLPRLDALN